jgi:hypothetical protein
MISRLSERNVSEEDEDNILVAGSTCRCSLFLLVLFEQACCGDHYAPG